MSENVQCGDLFDMSKWCGDQYSVLDLTTVNHAHNISIGTSRVDQKQQNITDGEEKIVQKIKQVDKVAKVLKSG